MTVYVFASSGVAPNNCFAENSFTIIINELILPEVDDVASCTEYSLPALVMGNYYTASGGGGTMLFAGDTIAETMEVFIYAIDGTCSDEVSFLVTIGSPGNISLQSVTECGLAGFSQFDLSATEASILADFPSSIVTFHETMVDAQNGVNTVQMPTYMNIVSGLQVLYVRIANADGTCFTISQLSLIVLNCTDYVISGIITYDYDANGCTANDPPASNIQVLNINAGVTTYAYTDQNGNYTFTNVQEGMNTLNIQSGIMGPFTSMPAGQDIFVSSVSNNYTSNFCLTYTTQSSDAKVMIFPTNNAVPGFASTYTLQVSNIGTTMLDGSVTLEFDASKLDLVSAIPGPTAATGNTITFTFLDLVPFSSYNFYLNFAVNTPPTVSLGDILEFVANVSPTQIDSNSSNNTYSLSQTVVNSFDPNDKTCLEGEHVSLTNVPQYLNYLIRFQNMGTSSAVNVRITDDLDEKLDWSTFRPMAGSHNFSTTMSTEGQVTFNFDNINLPAESEDEPESHGYVAYQIKPLPDWDGTAILNSANIYFDFNEAIVTNTVSTSVAPLGVNESAFEAMVVYPNPATDEITVEWGTSISNWSYVIFDIHGKQILANEVTRQTQSTIDVSRLQSGMYLLKINSESHSLTRKLIIR
jgi:uncharacterized repeat protein (TIGR01451 family)